MKTLLLAGLAGAAALSPATAFANESAPNDSAQQQVIYDDSILMHDDRVIAGQSAMRGGASTYQGYWDGAYREDGTYQGEWQGTYRDADGRTYDGRYAGTFIGEGNPSQVGASYTEAPAAQLAPPVIVPDRPGTNYEAPLYEGRPQYSAPAQHPVYRPQYQTQYRYPTGWNGYYYPAYHYPGGTTIVIQSAPGTTTTTTYYED